MACVLQGKWSQSSLPFLKSKALTFSNTWLMYCQEGESPTVNELFHCIQPSKPGLCNQLSWTLWTSSHPLILIMGLHLVQLSVWDNMLKIHCCTFFFFLLIDFFFPSELNECFIGWELNNINGMNCAGEPQAQLMFRRKQEYPAVSCSPTLMSLAERVTRDSDHLLSSPWLPRWSKGWRNYEPSTAHL